MTDLDPKFLATDDLIIRLGRMMDNARQLGSEYPLPSVQTMQTELASRFRPTSVSECARIHFADGTVLKLTSYARTPGTSNAVTLTGYVTDPTGKARPLSEHDGWKVTEREGLRIGERHIGANGPGWTTTTTETITDVDMESYSEDDDHIDGELIGETGYGYITMGTLPPGTTVIIRRHLDADKPDATEAPTEEIETERVGGTFADFMDQIMGRKDA